MTDSTDSFVTRLRGRWLPLTVVAVVLVFGLYYPVGMLVAHKVDDNLDYQVAGTDPTAPGSRAVAMAAALIDREVNRNGWVANDPDGSVRAVLTGREEAVALLRRMGLRVETVAPVSSLDQLVHPEGD